MNKLILTLVLILTAVSAAFAGGGNEKRHKMMKEVKEFKMKFLAQEMELTDDQRDRFFSLYDAMMAEKHTAFKKVHEMEKKLKTNKDATEADYEAVARAITKSRAEDAEIDRKYDAEFSKFLSQKQIF